MRFPSTFIPARRRGFTLIELLVVIAIIAVLVGLLLPAIQKVRESANRMKCVDNLKNIGLGLHNFTDSNGVFPPARISAPPNVNLLGRDYAKNHGWAVFVLPYLEQKSLADSYNWDLDWNDANPQQMGVVSTQLRIMQCASAKPNRTVGGTANRACGDYAPMTGINANLVPGLVDTAGAGGVMRQGEVHGFADITDGTSHTIVIAEDAGRNEEWRLGKFFAASGAAGGVWADEVAAFQLRGTDATTGVRNGSGSPTVWTGTCGVNCNNDNEIYAFHPAGANAVFADGSVRFLRASIAIRTLGRLITRSGGEPAPADF